MWASSVDNITQKDFPVPAKHLTIKTCVALLYIEYINSRKNNFTSRSAVDAARFRGEGKQDF